VIDADLDPQRVAKKRYDNNAPRWQEIDGSEYPAFIADNAGRVIGGTAWDFANANRFAGQPGSAGDRRGRSVLFGEHHRRGARGREPIAAWGPTAAAAGQSGYASRTGRRLGAGVAGRRSRHATRRARLLPGPLLPDAPGGLRAVSALSYEGRLQSHTECTAARRLEGHQPGVRVLTVVHQGNSTESPEEADAIAAEIKRLLGASWTDEHGTRPLAATDVLVLAPYNAQVALVRQVLATAGLSGVRVGTVDKFQARRRRWSSPR